jgi:predicted branched-subunit amino acid permease
MSVPPAAMPPKASDPASSRAAFVGGLKAASVSVFMLVLTGTYISIGALAQGLGFPLLWVVLSTVLIWAAPAQVILITTLGAGAPPLEAAIAVGLSAIRLLPMVVALLPVLQSRKTRAAELILPAHFTAVSMWIEALRLAPGLPREHRIAFANGLGTGLVAAAVVSTIAGYHLAGILPNTLVAAMLFLTPMSFLTSAFRNARLLSDQAAFVIGIVMAPLLAYEQVGLDLLWTGVVGGSAAYGLHRLQQALR